MRGTLRIGCTTSIHQTTTKKGSTSIIDNIGTKVTIDKLPTEEFYEL